MERTKEFRSFITIESDLKKAENFFYDDILTEMNSYKKALEHNLSLSKIQKIENQIIKLKGETNSIFKPVLSSKEYRNVNSKQFFDGIKSFFDESFHNIFYIISLKKNIKIKENDSIINFEEQNNRNIEYERNYMNKESFKNRNELKKESLKFYEEIKKDKKIYDKINRKVNEIDKIQNVINKCLLIQGERISNIVENINSTVDNVVNAGDEVNKGVVRKRRTRKFLYIFCNVSSLCLIFLYFTSKLKL